MFSLFIILYMRTRLINNNKQMFRQLHVAKVAGKDKRDSTSYTV
jgi:hypothetical protein